MEGDEIAQVKLPRSLDDARVTTLPPTAYYIPDFITPAEEVFLLNKVRFAPALSIISQTPL